LTHNRFYYIRSHKKIADFFIFITGAITCWQKLKEENMDKSTVCFMDARSRRFLESTAIKGCQILEHSGWLDKFKPGDIFVG